MYVVCSTNNVQIKVVWFIPGGWAVHGVRLSWPDFVYITYAEYREMLFGRRARHMFPVSAEPGC